MSPWSEPGRFLESLALVEGQVQHLEDHQTRVDRVRREVFGLPPRPLAEDLPDLPHLPGLWKLRLVYGPDPLEWAWEPYHRRIIRTITLVEAPHLDYRYKSADRSALDRLRQEHPEADEVLITQRGRLTDASYANLALWDGRTWFTPERPLLEGTQRTRLIRAGLLRPADLHAADLSRFRCLVLINAFNDLESGPCLPLPEALVP